MAFSNFGKTVKKKLVDIDQTQKGWQPEQTAMYSFLSIDGPRRMRCLAAPGIRAGENPANKILRKEARKNGLLFGCRRSV